MNTAITPLNRRIPSPAVSASDHIDQLMQDYLVWSAEALDVLVALYEAVDSGDGAPAEAGDFAARIGSWEDRLSVVLSQLGNRTLPAPTRSFAAFG